ncbi:N-acetylglucosamine kinase-like BadF-type ATPase [Nonomuraea polychroma]|uniref:N-acetylglucosamine kinase-like BadF-type ATPase n=1 Tax=Nonomuraea polychroma TaxID=46176 RepID=A0A438MHY0_9ACTN|nr:BadF/BadG/BcrA/BcrD ATPase family protein [Nonomuraea polychroma]RVX45479.1 N-acetylglucosamine kinase-like BadF-type ATPase [Nonomuraea polychroma]
MTDHQSFICVDGGKSELRLLVSTGEHRQYGVGPGMSYQPGEDGVARILGSVRAAAASVRLPAEPAGVAAGLTGVPGDPPARRRLVSLLEEFFGCPVLVVEDGLLAHAGALGGAGTVLCVGTGTTVLAVGASGRSVKIDGWGPLLGDRGSAHAIGLAGLRAAAAAYDGVGPATELADRLLAELGGTDLADLQRFYRDAALVARTAAFARTVMDAAEHDAVARGICVEAAEALAASAAAAVSRLPDAGRRVSSSGRLLAPGNLLHTSVAANLSDRGLDLVAPLATSLEGGLILLRSEEPYRGLLRRLDTRAGGQA